MMYFNKIYSSSNERIITTSPSTNRFDIELQHPQPRRRQMFDHNHENDDNKDLHLASGYSTSPKQGEFYSSELGRLSPSNNMITIPTNIPTISAPGPIIVPPSPLVVEEKHLTLMARSILSGLILILLPIALLSGTIFRFSVISFIYGFLLLILPWLGTINQKNIRRRFRLLVIIVGLVSLLAILAQLIFQSILLANKPYGHTLSNCTEITQILQYFGLERLDNSNAVRVLRLIFPDIIVFAVSIICFVIIRRTLINSKRQEITELQTSTTSNATNLTPSSNSTTSVTNKKPLWPRLLSVVKRIRLFIQFVIVGFAAFVYPSIINSIYFIFFLVIALTWSLSIKFGRKFALVRALLVVYAGMHLLTFYLYQFAFFQEVFPPLSLWSNITGLTAIVRSNCTESEPSVVTNLLWTDYVNPCALLLLYLYFAFETNRTFFHQARSNTTTMQSVEQQSLVSAGEARDSLEQESPSTQRRRSSEYSNNQTWQERIIFVVSSILRVLERQSYLLSIISMLAWSITYSSLLTLIFLLWACLLWILPNSRKWCLRMSPLFTVYGAILLILQYLSGFKISFNQLNFAYDNDTMKQIGIEIKDYQSAFLPLFAKSFYMMFFWLTFRQYINERAHADIRPFESHRLSSSSNSYPRRLGRWIINLLTKYWIFVSCGMLLIVSIQNTVVIYRIIYVAFYLFFILSFQTSFGFWRKTAATFHLTIIIYSMVILIGLYIYQFKTVHDFLRSKFSEDLLLSIGLEVLRPEILALKLLSPSAFLVVNIMQLYYFHSGWMELITMPSAKNIQGPANGTLKDIHAYAKQNTEDPNSPHAQRILQNEARNWQESLYKFYFRANRVYKQIIYYTWRFGELHSYKLVLFIMVLISILKISAFNVTLIILATIGLALLRLRPLINLLTLISTGLYILASMCYQLQIAKKLVNEENILVKNCPEIDSNTTLDGNPNRIPNDTAKWFGLESTPQIDQFVGVYVLLTIVLTFDAIVRYRQRHRRLTLSLHFNVLLIENRFPVLFEPFAFKDFYDDTYQYDIDNYQQADQGLIQFLKYLSNFIFYRFGLEICYITTIIVIGVRLDVVAVLYAIWLGLFLISRRRSIQRLWPIYLLFLIIVFPLQYMIAVGAPPLLCFQYPWRTVDINGWKELKRWLYLPDYANPPTAIELIADFFQLLFACQQWRVFGYENNDKDRVYVEAGGSNREIIYDEDIYKNNPTWDFVTNKRNWLDHIKYAIFMYGAWCVLSIVYLAGTTRISLLGLGYLVACFYFLWYGQDFLTKRVAVMFRLWNYLIYYCFAVVFLKACLQVAVCIFLYPIQPCTGTSRTSLFCTLVDLFVPCLKSEFKPSNDCYASYTIANEQCDRNVADASLFMDGFCMAFLLLQKRIFGSYYWEHIATEYLSQAKLASQGAVLFNEMSQKRIEEDRKREDQTVSKITRSLERIKEQQSKLNRSSNKPNSALAESSEHFEAIRSGDYYMFDYESDEEEVDEGKTDEVTVAQEQILQVLTATDKEAAAVVETQKSQPSSLIEPDTPLITSAPSSSPPPPPTPTATTTALAMIPVLPTDEQGTSVEPKEVKSKKKRKSILIKIRLIGWIVIDYLTNLFNRHSRDYREVSRKLGEMKSRDKTIQQEHNRTETNLDTALVLDIDERAIDAYPNRSSQPIDLSERSRFYRLFDSLFYFTMSRSELLCYSAMIINHLTSGTLLSMPLPLSIFLWATLSSRPSRNYWITVLTYTEAMIVVEYIFQFRFYPWNSGAADTRPLAAINIIGIDRKETASSVADLFLLLCLFLHRSILKELGLWKSEKKISPTTTDPIIVDAVRNEQPQESNNQVETTRISSDSYFMKPILHFYRQLQQALFVRDVYAPMFFCDFINMIIVIGFYSQFGLTGKLREQAGGNVVQTIKANKVPVAFLIILLIQFILIIIDRALYLRRNVRGKLFFQLFQVIVVHIWLFFVLPGITRTKFRDNVAAQFWYIFKCIYFGYSSIQVRLGYPKRLAGNFLMKRFNYINQVLYRVYLLIPFLLELRTIMDWMFTDTALGLSSWLQFEDIYSNVYLLKCARWAEKKYPTERGVSRAKITKYGVGGSLLALLILLIWFPLLLFSFTSSFYLPNLPKEVNVEIKLGGYLPIYQMTAQDSDLVKFTDTDYKSLSTSIYSPNIGPTIEDAAYAFLRDFNPSDISCVNLFSTSVNLWDISQPIRDSVVESLEKTDNVVPVRFSYTITRNPPSEDDSEQIAAVVSGENIINIEADDRSTRDELIQILTGTNGSQTMTNFTIHRLIPRFLHLKPKAEPEEIKQFEKVFPLDYRSNITMSLNGAKSIPDSTDVWWAMSENRSGFKVLPSCLQKDGEYLSMIFFNDKVSPATISFITQYGIIGLYTTFVVVVARLLRTILQTSQTIMFNELPNVERLWYLLRDIYLARENDKLRIEEQLFAKLLFLYRSTETLIRFTKPKVE